MYRSKMLAHKIFFNFIEYSHFSVLFDILYDAADNITVIFQHY